MGQGGLVSRCGASACQPRGKQNRPPRHDAHPGDLTRAALAHDMLWLPGGGDPLLAIALDNGQLRRAPLAPASGGASLFTKIDTTMHGVQGLAHSPRLQVLAYATGGGDVGIACGMARMPADYVFSHTRAGWTSRYAPHAIAWRVACAPSAPTVIQVADDLGHVQPLFEMTRGA